MIFYSNTKFYKIKKKLCQGHILFCLQKGYVTFRAENSVWFHSSCSLKPVVTSTLWSNSLLVHDVAERVAGRSNIILVQISLRFWQAYLKITIALYDCPAHWSNLSYQAHWRTLRNYIYSKNKYQETEKLSKSCLIHCISCVIARNNSIGKETCCNACWSTDISRLLHTDVLFPSTTAISRVSP